MGVANMLGYGTLGADELTRVCVRALRIEAV